MELQLLMFQELTGILSKNFRMDFIKKPLVATMS